jgi:RND superfamily putative drug exporter
MFLASVARSLSSHWKRSLAAAVGVLVLLVVAAGAGGKAADDYSLPGTESQQAVDLFKAHSPAFGGADSTLVFTVDAGKVSDPAPKAAIEGALTKVRRLGGVKLAASPFDAGGQISEDGRLAAVDVRYSTDPSKIEKKDGKALIATAETAEPAVQVEERGALVDLAAEQSAPVGELIGVLIAIVLLTVLFRSAWAMGATLIGALIGVAAGQILLAALAKPLGLPSFAAVIAVMLGLGAGIDYSLLIIGRYREQRAAGDDVKDAAARAAATSGAAVVAAGVIVMVAIAGLLVVGVPYIGKMGLGAAIAVGAVVVSALTILPIMMGAFGRKLVPKKPEHSRGSRSPRASCCCWCSLRRSRRCASGSPTTATRPSRTRSGSPTTSSPRRSARARTARSCSRWTRPRARRTPRDSSPRWSRPWRARPGLPRWLRHRSARTARWRPSSSSRPPRPRTHGPPSCSPACVRT